MTRAWDDGTSVTLAVFCAEDVVRGACAIVAAKVGVSRTKVVEVAPRYFLV